MIHEAMYSIRDLALILKRDPRTVKKWLLKNGTAVVRIGHADMVWTSELIKAFPQVETELWRLSDD